MALCEKGAPTAAGGRKAGGEEGAAEAAGREDWVEYGFAARACSCASVAAAEGEGEDEAAGGGAAAGKRLKEGELEGARFSVLGACLWTGAALGGGRRPFFVKRLDDVLLLASGSIESDYLPGLLTSMGPRPNRSWQKARGRREKGSWDWAHLAAPTRLDRIYVRTGIDFEWIGTD